jgi:hypothetical protein
MDSIAIRRILGRSAGALFFGLVVACSGKDPYSPGTKLGTFHVSAKLTQTTCGSVPNPWEFDVRINHDGPTLYWIQGGAPIQGRVDATARTQLHAQVVQEVRRADQKTRTASCSIARTDVLAVTLVGADGKPTTDPALMTSFGGDLIYAFTPTEGSACDDQLATVGGDFDALPCEVHYDLSGVATASPPETR